MGAIKLADRAPREEVLYFKATINQTNSITEAPIQFIKKSMPAEVAIPFPPFSNKKGLNIWPSKDSIEISTYKIINNSFSNISIKLILTKYRKAKLLDISNNRVNNANNLLPVLKTLVAPIFPEPIFLISPYPEIFVTINPNGMEPIIKLVIQKTRIDG